MPKLSMRALRPALATAWLLITAHGAPAADAQAGRALSAQCATCHGPKGLSTLPDAPNLAGQPAIYLEAQLRNYRAGRRSHEVMSVIAKPLSDRDIENLAAWYASFRIQAQFPD